MKESRADELIDNITKLAAKQAEEIAVLRKALLKAARQQGWSVVQTSEVWNDHHSYVDGRDDEYVGDYPTWQEAEAAMMEKWLTVLEEEWGNE